MAKTLLRCAFGLSILLSSLLMVGQQAGTMDQNAGSSMHGQTITATGCLQKGQESGGYFLKDENGKSWELTGNNLGPHVGHKVMVTGHEVKASKSKETKVEPSEKSEAGGEMYSDLHVTHLKMVSDSCQ